MGLLNTQLASELSVEMIELNEEQILLFLKAVSFYKTHFLDKRGHSIENAFLVLKASPVTPETILRAFKFFHTIDIFPLLFIPDNKENIIIFSPLDLYFSGDLKKLKKALYNEVKNALIGCTISSTSVEKFFLPKALKYLILPPRAFPELRAITERLLNYLLDCTIIGSEQAVEDVAYILHVMPIGEYNIEIKEEEDSKSIQMEKKNSELRDFFKKRFKKYPSSVKKKDNKSLSSQKS